MQQHFCSTTSSKSFYPLELMEASDEIGDDDIAPSKSILLSHHHHHQHDHEDRAVAAMRNHKEAEKRRRERINSHLDKLRTLLPCNSKTDKASLLGKVVERVRELKQQTSQITTTEEETNIIPSEKDEVSVLSVGGSMMILKASLSCEDRSDLIPDVIQILKSHRLKTVRAEIATLGGRTRNVLLLAPDDDHNNDTTSSSTNNNVIDSVHFLHNSFKSLLQRSDTDRSKRRRLMDPTFIPN